MEKLAMKQYSANIAKGKEIVEYFVNQLRDEGITFVPVWSPPSNLPQSPDEVSSTIKFKEELSVDDVRKSRGEQFQLEADYIRRYLGELSLIQESSLVQLKKWVADLQKGKVKCFPCFYK